jgi:hypothetical protein
MSNNELPDLGEMLQQIRDTPPGENPNIDKMRAYAAGVENYKLPPEARTQAQRKAAVVREIQEGQAKAKTRSRSR